MAGPMTARIICLLMLFVAFVAGCSYWVTHWNPDIERYQTKQPRM
jgi:hypothetical protein